MTVPASDITCLDEAQLAWRVAYLAEGDAYDAWRQAPRGPGRREAYVTYRAAADREAAAAVALAAHAA